MPNSLSFQRPFLKWAGNKFRLLKHIIPHLPKGNRLIEPFAGSGSLTLNTQYDAYWLNDLNADLVGVYRQLKQRPTIFIAACEAICQPENNQADHYYQLREEFNACEDPYRRAVLFVYLNRHGFNGLCRYNKKGLYNVPFGRHVKPSVSKPALQQFAKRLKHTKLTQLDFRTLMQQATDGDVVYCDPPYLPLTETANFTHYHHQSFEYDDQLALAQAAKQLAERGITTLISNHHCPLALELYEGAEIIDFEALRLISCKGVDRKPVREILAIYPHRK